MRYFGSKTSTLSALGELIASVAPRGTFCDCFGGIGTVGAYFKTRGFQVVTGDVLRFAYYFQVARVQTDENPRFLRLFSNIGLSAGDEVGEYLNRLEPEDGWLVQEYAAVRSFFTIENARKIQVCWNEINRWDAHGWLEPVERAILLASLIQSVDLVANTAGTYYAYLKNFHRKALRPFAFSLISPSPGAERCRAYWEEASVLVRRSQYDILYLDPPYNARVYSRYYHLPETLAAGRAVPVHGRAGIPNETPGRSSFNDRRSAYSALEAILEVADFRLLVFHYADDGLISPNELRRLFDRYSRVEEHVLSSKGYSVQRAPRMKDHRVYLIWNA